MIYIVIEKFFFVKVIKIIITTKISNFNTLSNLSNSNRRNSNQGRRGLLEKNIMRSKGRECRLVEIESARIMIY